MNKKRRLALSLVLDALDKLRHDTPPAKAIAVLTKAAAKVESCMDDEQMAFDCIPENFQDTQRADDMNDNICDLDEARECLEIAIESLTSGEAKDVGSVKDDINSAYQSINKAIVR